MDIADMGWDDHIGGFRVWTDGVRSVWVIPMIYNHRVAIGVEGDTGYEHGWCYPNATTAIAAALNFDPHTDDEPVGYIKRATVGRRQAHAAR